MTTSSTLIFPDTKPSARDYKCREVALHIEEGLSSLKLIELYTGIEQSVGHDRGLVIQFVCGHPSDGAEKVALDMCWIAASSLGKRILLLDGTHETGCRLVPPTARSDNSFTEAAMGYMEPEDAIAKVAGVDMFIADLRNGRLHPNVLGAAPQLARLLAQLRPLFDMIVIVPPPTQIDPLAAIMGRHLDGSVMVVRAEGTRSSDALSLKNLLSRTGGRLLGAIMTNERKYVPNWLDRRL